MQTSLPPSPLRSGQLDIRDAQCVETKDMLKNHITSYSVFELWASKRGRYGHPKIKFCLKVAKSARKIGIDLKIIFRIIDFFFQVTTKV